MSQGQEGHTRSDAGSGEQPEEVPDDADADTPAEVRGVQG